MIGESVCTARKFLATFVAKHKSVNKDVMKHTEDITWLCWDTKFLF